MPPTFEELRTRAQRARRQAKAIRTEWKSRGDSTERDNAFESALRELDEVIDGLRVWEEEQSAYRRDAKREIGDCLGVKGGTHRDCRQFESAADAYDDGLPYEMAVNEMGGQPNSYCLVQRLVARVLASPEAFCRSEPILDLELRVKLTESLSVVRDQMRVRRSGDPWAQADLALMTQLLTSCQDASRGVSDAMAAWDQLDDMRPDRGVYESTLDVVQLIIERLEPYLSETERNQWADVASRLAES